MVIFGVAAVAAVTADKEKLFRLLAAVKER